MCFYEEMKKKEIYYNKVLKKLYFNINYTFDYMSIGAIINDTYLAVHGGIGSSFKYINELNFVEKPIYLNKFKKDKNILKVYQILYNDCDLD